MRLLDRLKETLVNPTWEQSVEREPLIAFSYYLSGRTNELLQVGDEIINHLDQGFANKDFINSTSADHIRQAGTLIWLWTLGAYEIVRTMCQARDCFSERVNSDLLQLKKSLASVRMPDAKMEKAGKKLPVTSNRSPNGWDMPNRDLLIGDPEGDIPTSARHLIIEFDRVMSSITKEDVICRHEDSYSNEV
jgi:hypothetical protein